MQSLEGDKSIKKPLADEDTMWNSYREFLTEKFRDMVLDFANKS